MEIGSRQYRLGNYEKSAGYPPEAQSHFLDRWSEIKVWIFGNRPGIYAVYAAAVLGVVWTRAARSRAKMHVRALFLAATLTCILVAPAGAALI